MIHIRYYDEKNQYRGSMKVATDERAASLIPQIKRCGYIVKIAYWWPPIPEAIRQMADALIPDPAVAEYPHGELPF